MSSVIEWVDEPPAAPRKYVSWKNILSALQTRPGQWAKVAENVHVEAVRDAAKKHPIETRVEGVEGRYAALVYARYVPEDKDNTQVEWSNR